jgi:hypothetical protein
MTQLRVEPGAETRRTGKSSRLPPASLYLQRLDPHFGPELGVPSLRLCGESNSHSAPRKSEFPVYQGKYREFSRSGGTILVGKIVWNPLFH